MLTGKGNPTSRHRKVAWLWGVSAALFNTAVLLAEVPVILRTSDAVAPGRIFSVNGEGFDAATLDLAVTPYATGAAPLSPPKEATHPTILQSDKDGHFLVATLPADGRPGSYSVWVKNRDGWSKPITLNAPRPLFMSEYEASEGNTISLVGRNLQTSEFKGTTGTRVRLNDGFGNTSLLTVKSLEPYRVKFTVAQQKQGTYFVEVSNNDGLSWSRLDNGQTLTIVPPAADPLALGVAWAGDFNWNNRVDVSAAPYNATGDINVDVTSAVQRALDDVERAGGGVVYLPAGNYRLGYIQLGSGVVLQGAGMDKTIIYYGGSGGFCFIASRGNNCLGGVAQLQGVARLAIRLLSPENVDRRPDVIFQLGYSSSSGSLADQVNRTANRLFLSEIDLSYPWTNGDSSATRARRGIAALWMAKERVLLQKCHFSGWMANNASTYANQYVSILDNSYEYSGGTVHNTANYLFCENNQVRIHPEYNQEIHGIFVRSDAYIATNTIEYGYDAKVQATYQKNGRINDGEGICAEFLGGGPFVEGAFNYGVVASARESELTVRPAKAPMELPSLYYGRLSVVITLGRGLGQMRAVTGIDPATNKIRIDKPFAVIPDETSRFSLLGPNQNVTVYNNTISNSAVGILLFGNAFDWVVAGNSLFKTDGISVHAVYLHKPDDPQDPHLATVPCYFNRIVRNRVIGVSPWDNHCGISIETGRWGPGPMKFSDVLAYSTEILENVIEGEGSIDRPTYTGGYPLMMPFSGLGVSSFGYSTMSDKTGTGDVTNTLMVGNILSNLPDGVTVTRSNYGQVICDNLHNNVLNPVVDGTAYLGKGDQTLLNGNWPITIQSSATVQSSDFATQNLGR